jgi:hypothetical protein
VSYKFILFLNVQNTVYNRLHLLKFVQCELECLSSLESQGFVIDHLLNEKVDLTSLTTDKCIKLYA